MAPTISKPKTFNRCIQSPKVTELEDAKWEVAKLETDKLEATKLEAAEPEGHGWFDIKVGSEWAGGHKATYYCNKLAGRKKDITKMIELRYYL